MLVPVMSPTEEVHNDNDKALKSYINDSNRAKFMSYYESIGLGYDFINKSADIYKKITPEMIKDVANRYFDKIDVIVSIPNDDVKKMVQ